jgi:hypothetical protein
MLTKNLSDQRILPITDISVNILALSIASLQLAWSIWKARNKVKYDKIHINQNVLCNIWKQALRYELKILLTANCNDAIDKAKILTLISVAQIRCVCLVESEHHHYFIG